MPNHSPSSPYKTKDNAYYPRVKRLIADQLDALHGALPLHDCNIWGELLSKEVRGGELCCKLRDPEEAISIDLTLPTKTQVEVGEYILVRGRIVLNKEKKTGKIYLSIDGAEIKKSQPSHRFDGLRSLVSKLMVGHSARPVNVANLRSIALVVSKKSRARSDFYRALGKHAKHVTVSEYSASVMKAASLCSAIQKAGASNCDLMVITRGGGDRISFAAFDDDSLVEAIALAARKMPLVLALGHAEDSFEVDRLASKVCDTPAGAGNFIVKERSRHFNKQQKQRDSNVSSPSPKSPLVSGEEIRQEREAEARAAELRGLVRSIAGRKSELAQLQEDPVVVDSHHFPWQWWRVFLLLLLVGVLLGLLLSHAATN